MTSLTFLIGPFQEFLNLFQRDKFHRQDMDLKTEEFRQDALSAIYSALITTSKYIEEQTADMDRPRQLELAQLWATAAIKSRTYLSADVPWMADKAEYYLSRMEWPEDRVVEAGIDLATVRERITGLIAE